LSVTGVAALAVLRRRNPACYALGRFCGTLSAQMLVVGVGWHVYAIAHDPLALGLAGLSAFLPFVTLVLVGGHVADNAERRIVVVCAYMIQALCALALLLVSATPLHSVWPIYLLLGVFGATHAFWAPAMQAMLPQLVTREEFGGAVALNTMLYQIASVAGPVLGGVLYLIGPRAVYGACLLLFAITSAMMYLIRAPTRSAEPPAIGSTRRFLEGLRFVLHNRLVLGVISLDLFAVLFGGVVALLPVYASDVLHTGPVGLGLLRAAPGAGAALAGVALALRPIRNHAGSWLLGGVAVFGVCMIVFGLSRNFALSCAVLLVGGSGDMISVYIRAILVQVATPDAIRGRVSAVNSMFIGASNELGEFESGLTASWFGTVPAVVIGGVLTLACALSWAFLFPPLRRLKHLH
jgi:MFS family permease